MTIADCHFPARTDALPRSERSTPCEVCGSPALQREGQPRRKLCRSQACEDFRKFLAAARRAVVSIDFPETPDGRAAQRRAIADILAVRNDLPLARHAQRGESGRFYPGPFRPRVRGRCERCGRLVNVTRGCERCPKAQP